MDLLVEDGELLTAVEVTSAATVASDFFAALTKFADQLAGDHPARKVSSRIVYGGERRQRRGEARVVPWRDAWRLP